MLPRSPAHVAFLVGAARDGRFAGPAQAADSNELRCVFVEQALGEGEIGERLLDGAAPRLDAKYRQYEEMARSES